MWWPEEIASHAPACAGVGPSNAEVNHSRAGALNRASTSADAPGPVVVPVGALTDVIVAPGSDNRAPVGPGAFRAARGRGTLTG
ncbi:hypothetical protein GCM10028777_40980 [Angustibacter speluncae]